ncbi:hypothetical protein [Brevundimonas sp. FT23042]|jgi:hypothetical protein|uniref:hypothetical protein n=1 Tax=Brevundimonas sp. FT23042 TaxID=3393749 RepID=UPI003B588FF9
MSILKKLKKNNHDKNNTVLKPGIVLLLDTQEQFNKLASCMSLQEDSILIDGVYVAYMDEYPALQVEPIENLTGDIENALEAFRHKNLKPLDIDVWFKRNKIA